MFVTLARREGLLVIADGYDRVPHDRREDVKAMLRNDYPKMRLLVLSRANVAPSDLGLPTLRLEGYDCDELRKLADKRAATRPDAIGAFTRAPEYIYRIAEVPLLADLLHDRYERAGDHPVRIAALYEGWIDRILTSAQPVDRAWTAPFWRRSQGRRRRGRSP